MRSAFVRHASSVAFVLLVLTVVAATIGIGAGARYHPGDDSQLPQRLAELVAWGVTGAILLARRPDLSFGWIFAAGALAEVLYVGVGVPAYVAFQQGDGSPALLWAYSLAGIQWVPSVLTGVVFARFPSGVPTGAAGRIFDRVIRWGIVVGVVAGFLEDWSGNAWVGPVERLVDRTAIPQVASQLLVVIPLLVLLSAAAGVSVVVRWYRARDVERRQLAWMAAGAAAYLVGWPVTVAGLVPSWLAVVLVLVFPLCLLVPVLRYDLWAFESIVRRSATYHLKGGGPIDGLVRATAEMLRLPYVAVVRGGTVLSSYGETAADVESWPVHQDGEECGELLAAPRFGHASIDPVDREVLGSTARLVAGSLRAEVLTSDLRDARQQLVTAREEERRRLRRDLHDGIGPMLTGLGLNLDAARADPERAGEYLSNAKEASGEVIRSLREVVYALRPPSLDDLGFPGALRLRVGQVAGHLDVTVSVPDALRLPAAVEVAALRTAVEAVHNVVRHGDATKVRVTVESSADLVVTVVDDGGSSAWGAPGVGLASMRERAEELGGTLEAGPTSAGGRVRATFPLGGTP